MANTLSLQHTRALIASEKIHEDFMIQQADRDLDVAKAAKDQADAAAE